MRKKYFDEENKENIDGEKTTEKDYKDCWFGKALHVAEKLWILHFQRNKLPIFDQSVLKPS